MSSGEPECPASLCERAALRRPARGTRRVGLNIEDLEFGPLVTKGAMDELSQVLTKDNRKRTRTQQSEKGNKKRVCPSDQGTMTMQTFPFFALPTELRLAVYFELLVTDDRLVVTWQGPRKVYRHQKKMHIGILLASRRCRDEGVTVLYGENIFDMGEICELPASTSKHFTNRIGLLNASLIRIVIAEYSVAAEDFLRMQMWRTILPVRTGLARTCLSQGIGRQCALPHRNINGREAKNHLATFGIDIMRLRVFAISIKPYGDDQASMDVMWRQYPLLVGSATEREKWLKVMNETSRLAGLADMICTRDETFCRADYSRDIYSKIGFWWSPHWLRRNWIVYKGTSENYEEGSMGRQFKGTALLAKLLAKIEEMSLEAP